MEEKEEGSLYLREGLDGGREQWNRRGMPPSLSSEQGGTEWPCRRRITREIEHMVECGELVVKAASRVLLACQVFYTSGVQQMPGPIPDTD